MTRKWFRLSTNSRTETTLTIFSETKLEVLQDMSKEPPHTIIKSQAAKGNSTSTVLYNKKFDGENMPVWLSKMILMQHLCTAC
jgi:hypothetical protein